MASFVLGILEDPKAVRTFAKLSSSLRVAQAFKGADPLGVLLDEQDWAHLCELVREPTEGYTSAAYALKAFCDAILDAPEGP